MVNNKDIYKNIISILNSLNITYKEIEHPEVKTCEDSAKYRAQKGLNGIGSKNILFHAKGKFYLVVTIATTEIKARRFKKQFGTKNIRFANETELQEVTACKSGSLPPFGYLTTQLPIYVDKEIFEHKNFMFNPAIPTKTISINTKDLLKVYKNIEQPVILFSKTKENQFQFENIKDTN